MKEELYYLDPTVEVLHDDQSRIILLPNDRRNVLRVAAVNMDIIELIKAGVNKQYIQKIKDDVKKESPFALRFRKIFATLENNELLNNSRKNYNRGLYRFKGLTNTFDLLAKLITYPIYRLLSSSLTSFLFLIIFIGILSYHIYYWYQLKGLLFIGLATPYWWLAILFYLFVYPFIHEFWHALAARSFGFRISSVGIDYQNIRHYRPFIEVKKLMLISDPHPKIWVPLFGVMANMLMALLAIIIFINSDKNSLMSGVSGVSVLILYWRVLVDAGLKTSTDATKALIAAEELYEPVIYWIWKSLIRGIYFLFLIATIIMLVLSLGHYISDLTQ